ncbi:MAG: hypothetical protein M1821_005460 [Bathelium mastoideum]|nr:MAG: hypothetical protein M1821_005460 [Bathelium mastoideum]
MPNQSVFTFHDGNKYCKQPFHQAASLEWFVILAHFYLIAQSDVVIQDKSKRDAALESLRIYINRRTSFDELELLKLWKGLFFCMWMSDKPKPQQQLARDLAELVQSLQPQNVIPFLDAFWRTIAREWVGIDVFRMDKFLYLIRQYLAASFRFFAQRDWRNTDDLMEYLDVLTTTPLHPTDSKVPDGLRYHVMDIYVDELDRVDPERKGLMPIKNLLRPIKLLKKQSHTKAIRVRAQEVLSDERLADWQANDTYKEIQDGLQANGDQLNESANNDVDEEWGGIGD